MESPRGADALLTGHERIRIRIRIRIRKGRFMGSRLFLPDLLTGHEPIRIRIKIKIKRGRFMGQAPAAG
jgi:hypothetical protein